MRTLWSKFNQTFFAHGFTLHFRLGAHHIDLRASTPNDPDWLVEQRTKELEIIQGWLLDYYQQHKAVSSYGLASS